MLLLNAPLIFVNHSSNEIIIRIPVHNILLKISIKESPLEIALCVFFPQRGEKEDKEIAAAAWAETPNVIQKLDSTKNWSRDMNSTKGDNVCPIKSLLFIAYWPYSQQEFM